MKNLLLPIFIAFISMCFGQDHDKNWIIGQYVSYDGSILSFEDSSKSVTRQKLGIDIRLGGVSMSNSEGKIQFYSNGTTIASAIDHKIMKNGLGLSPGSDGEDYNNTGYQILPRKSFLAYPDAQNENIFYLIYSFLVNDTDYHEISNFLQIAKIDMKKNGGKGEVVYKNKVLFNQSSVNKIEIVKHANGFSWWLITRGLDGKEYNSILLEGDSVIQIVRSPVESSGISLNSKEDSVLYNGISPFHISPKGNKLIDYYGKSYRRLFSFDRCSGVISLQDTFKVDTDTTLFEEGSSPLIFTFSPNEKFLYAWNTNGFHQWDTEADDISNSEIILGGPTYFIEKNGNIFRENSWVPTGGQLAPDGRIYYMFNWSQYVINNPDEKCPDCGFCYAIDYPINGCLDGFEVAYGSTPYFPNFRLGPIDGSTCDSLGINNIPLAKFRKERPDSSQLFFNFKDLTAYEPTSWSWNFGDGSTSTLQNPSHEFTSPGFYNVCLTASNSNGSDVYCQHLDLRTSSIPTNKEQKFKNLIYPNPAKGFLQIGLPIDVGILNLTLFDGQGKMIKEYNSIQPGEVVSLPDIPSGLYFYQMRNKKGDSWSGKIIIE